jgi:DHA1 family bicyclomycin/chloramphenicol resistance-like MFS transporter
MARLPLKHPVISGMIAAGFALLALGTDMLIPSLPALVADFGIPVSGGQMLLSAFVISFAVSQLFYGPLSDRFGRRPVLLAGGAIFTVGSAASAFAPTIDLLMAGRVMQGIGCCAAPVLGRAIVRDVWGAEGTARMLGYTTAAAALAIFSGPVVAGVIQQHFGWRANFGALALYGGILLVMSAVLLDESNLHRNPHATSLRTLWANLRLLLGNRRFMGYTLCAGCSYGAIMAYLSVSPFILINLLGVSAQEFGMLFSASILGYIIATLMTARLSHRASPYRLMATGTAIMALAATLMAVLALAGVRSVAAIVAPWFIFLFGTGLNNPPVMAGAVGPFPTMAGTASAVLGFLQLSMGAVVGLAIGRLHDGTPVPMSLAIAGLAWGILLAYHLLVRPGPRH